MIRLDFGNSLWNTPSATNLGPFPAFNMAHGLVMVKDSLSWVALVTCSVGLNLVRLNFGNSLTNPPIVTDFGNLAGFTSPKAICVARESYQWHALMVAGNVSLARIDFGNSLLNAPIGNNLGNPGGSTPRSDLHY